MQVLMIDKQPAASKGFTLLEIMVAMAIMAIVLVSVYRMHSQTLTMNSATRFYTQAPLLAQSKLAQVESLASELVAGDSGDFGEDFPNYFWEMKVVDATIPGAEELSDHLKQIDLKISWGDVDQYQYHLRLIRFFPKTS